MSADDQALAERIAERGHAALLERLRAAYAHQVGVRRGPDVDPVRLEQMVEESAARAGETLRRAAFAEAAARELDVSFPEAAAHPAVARALELGAPEEGTAEEAGLIEDAAGAEPIELAEPDADVAEAALAETDRAETDRAETERAETDGEEPEASGVTATSQALRLGAVHVNGIETLRAGDRDIELRLSDAGLDVLKRSSGGPIGRLEWSEIETIELPPPRRGLRGRRRPRELHVSTERGHAEFELPGLTESDLRDHLEPMLARARELSGGAS